MKMQLNRRALLGAAAGVLAAPALIGRAKAATTLKISTSYPNDPKYAAARIWYDFFTPALKAATDGAVTTLFFPDNQLGQEADVANQVKLGVVDAQLVGSSIWTNMVPEFGVFDMGYVFNGTTTTCCARRPRPRVWRYRSCWWTRRGRISRAWGRNIGAAQLHHQVQLHRPGRAVGASKIRCLPSPVVTETIRLMGAAATPMAFGEIYTGLQAGVIDGMEHDAPTILSAKFYETAKHFVHDPAYP